MPSKIRSVSTAGVTLGFSVEKSAPTTAITSDAVIYQPKDLSQPHGSGIKQDLRFSLRPHWPSSGSQGQVAHLSGIPFAFSNPPQTQLAASRNTSSSPLDLLQRSILDNLLNSLQENIKKLGSRTEAEPKDIFAKGIKQLQEDLVKIKQSMEAAIRKSSHDEKISASIKKLGYNAGRVMYRLDETGREGAYIYPNTEGLM
ncbi:hypothetical protein AOQ84DRAFT_371332 [Glonium stellatum]|uniref:Uncharacterized protein n=1 Tax=Glonium stellatum TaxID=574774 RepID=A0A8E2FCB2_9PEZI|nr:hypothetical protein AOQ84DRAFT_371332 [Glonium stellatum]